MGWRMEGLHLYLFIFGVAIDLQEDAGLVESYKNGSSQAMGQIVNKYKGTIYNIAYGMLGNVEDAEDITQEVFLRVCQKVSQFRFKCRFKTWLCRIVINLCINKKEREIRQASSTGNGDPKPLVEIETPETKALQAEKDRQIKAALDQLNEDYRAVVILRDMEGLSYKEIADVLECSQKLVKSRLHEARMKLRKFLTE